MEKRVIAFNGKYMVKDNVRGVQRYSREVINALDKLVKPGDVKVIVPYTDKVLDEFENIEIVQYGGKHTHFLWQCLGFQAYILKNNAISVCLSDGIPFFKLGIYALHDIRFLHDARNNKEYARKARTILERFITWWGVHNAKRIVTVSEFSKKEICENYKVPQKKIDVCYNAWQHLKNVEYDDGIFERFHMIKKGDYYFTLGGKADNKNIKWVKKMAVKYPDRLFVFAGPPLTNAVVDSTEKEELMNCVYVGYISDGEIKSLMHNCKAFLFPSKFEGFGIPPLEAISCGAKVFMSNATCLPEIYGDYVSYFDPDNYDADLDELYNEPHFDTELLLEKYSWEKSARRLLKIIDENF